MRYINFFVGHCWACSGTTAVESSITVEDAVENGGVYCLFSSFALVLQTTMAPTIARLCFLE